MNYVMSTGQFLPLLGFPNGNNEILKKMQEMFNIK